MPKIVKQPDDMGQLPRLFSEEEAPPIVRAGRHKWQTLRNQIPYAMIGRSRFWTEDALLEFLHENTVQPTTPDPSRPRRAVRAKPVPPPRKGPKPKTNLAVIRDDIGIKPKRKATRKPSRDAERRATP